MRFVFRSPAGSVFSIATATRRDAETTVARDVPGATYLGPVAPHMVPAIIAAKPATPAELRTMRRVLPDAPAAWDMLPPVPPARLAKAEPVGPHSPEVRDLIARRRRLVWRQ